MAKATSDSVVASRKLSLAFVTLLSLCISVQAEANFTLWVNRRSTTDVYSLKSNNTVTVVKQCGTIPNYLVNEKRCASDEELFSGIHNIIIRTVL
jgi:Golgi nucleoside diphosphatase